MLRFEVVQDQVVLRVVKLLTPLKSEHPIWPKPKEGELLRKLNVGNTKEILWSRPLGFIPNTSMLEQLRKMYLP